MFYHNLYNQYKNKGLTSDEALDKIKVITPEGKVAIKNSIKELNYLTSVYDATKSYKSDLKQLTHLDTDVLVSRVLRPLTKELNLELNDDLQVVSQNKKLYHNILGLLGKAVWIDESLNTRVFSVQKQWTEIVKSDHIIPGLAEKIKEYKELKKTKKFNEGEVSNTPDNDTKSTGDSEKDNNEISKSSKNNTQKNNSDSSTVQNKTTKYKFFVPKQSVTIKQQNYNLASEIDLIDNLGNEVSRQSSEYSKISISCSHQDIVIKNNCIESISENGSYDIDVEYDGLIKHFKLFLNIAVNNLQQDYQVLFKQQWYDESLALLSSNSKYFKIYEVVKSIQNYNVLSTDIGHQIIIAFLLRNLIEYSTKAYIELAEIRETQEKLPPLVSIVKNHLVTKEILTKTEAKAFNKHDIDIEALNGMIHDYKTEVSTVSIQSIAAKFTLYFSVIFKRLSEGMNNG